MKTIKKDRAEFIDFYAKKIREDKEGLWRVEHKQFIDSQINNANRFYERLILSENGVEKFRRVTGTSEKFAQEFYEMVSARDNVDLSLEELKKGKVEDL